ncbi:MAG TPA: MFS transporter [Terriglobia bacterium]|nr:MFS transporter [Terriglobia bacterium]
MPARLHPSLGTSGFRPTRVRWQIVAMLTLITALTYLDRMNMGIAGKYIQDEFAFNTQTMGWILSAFVLGYALFQVPGGWLGDRYSPRGVLTGAILWWSLFTAITGLVPRLPLRHWMGLVGSFILIRFLIGMGEAACLPNSNKIIAFWIGENRRGVANSMFLTGIGLGGALTPLLISSIMQRWGWEMSFYISGGLGVFVAVAWYVFATSRPEEHSSVNAGELEIIRKRAQPPDAPAREQNPERLKTPWKKLLGNVSTWCLMLSYFCEGYPNYIFYTWFFIYIVRVRGLTIKQGGLWGAAPFLSILIFAPLGGWFSDRATTQFGKRRGRQLTVWVGMTCSAILMTLGAHATGNVMAILFLSGAVGCNMFATSTWWATCNDLTRNFSGALSALMNMCGNLGGWISPILTAYIAVHLGWTHALDFAAMITFIAGVLWIPLNADQNLEV